MRLGARKYQLETAAIKFSNFLLELKVVLPKSNVCFHVESVLCNKLQSSFFKVLRRLRLS